MTTSGVPGSGSAACASPDVGSMTASLPASAAHHSEAAPFWGTSASPCGPAAGTGIKRRIARASASMTAMTGGSAMFAYTERVRSSNTAQRGRPGRGIVATTRPAFTETTEVVQLVPAGSPRLKLNRFRLRPSKARPFGRGPTAT